MSCPSSRSALKDCRAAKCHASRCLTAAVHSWSRRCSRSCMSTCQWAICLVRSRQCSQHSSSLLLLQLPFLLLLTTGQSVWCHLGNANQNSSGLTLRELNLLLILTTWTHTQERFESGGLLPGLVGGLSTPSVNGGGGKPRNPQRRRRPSTTTILTSLSDPVP